MSMLLIDGGARLCGGLSVQGAKNSVLPMLAATVLCSTPCVLHNCPMLSDVDASCRILQYLGCRVKQEGNTILVDPSVLSRSDIPDHLMREMRSSIVFLGSVSSRCGRAHIYFPGGCELGPRPIDLHLSALRQLGLAIDEDRGCLDCRAENGLHGATIALAFPSVGATENILLAASLAQGTTLIVNSAREPEICDLAAFLNACGARITGAGESLVRIEGVRALHGCEHRVIPDRIVSATYMAAVGATGGDVELRGIVPAHLSPVIPVFVEAGCDVEISTNSLRIRRTGALCPVKNVRTMPYPGFPTDAQAPLMAMASLAQGRPGSSFFIEEIFENRYKHVPELTRMGAKIKVIGKVAVVDGVEKIYGSAVTATDLRGGAALAVAALAAEGRTELSGVQHIDRGYESIERDLAALGAVIRRTDRAVGERPPG